MSHHSLLAALVVLLVSRSFAEPGQHGAGSSAGNLHVRVVYTDDRATTIYARVRLMPVGTSVATEEGFTNDTGMIDFNGVPVGNYHLQVSGDGIEDTDSGPFEVDSRKTAQHFFVSVRRLHETAQGEEHPKGSMVAAAELNVPSRARNEFDKASAEMAKQNWKKAVERLNRAIAIYPQYASAYNNLGVVHAHLGDRDRQREALQKAVSLNDHFAPAYVNLAKMAIVDGNFTDAETILSKATAADPSSAPTLVLLANVELLNQHYDAAVASCRKVHSMQTDSHALVHFIAARALEHENRPADALAELQIFVKEEPSGPRAEAARKEMAGNLAHSSKVEPRSWALSQTTQAVPDPQSWAPPDVDQTIPPVRTDIPCPMPQVLQAASRRVQELVANLQQFSATERIEDVAMDKNGAPNSPATGTFSYVAEIHEIGPGLLSVNEYRNGSLALDSFPTRLATTGTAAFALIFHPDYLDDFSMNCEGLANWERQPAWQVHFVQRSDRPSRFRKYRVANMWYPVKLKGRAWIGADTYQVLRLETDLVEPIKEIFLQRDHLEIEYGSVEFRKRNLQLWLPENADIYLDFRGHRYHDRHSFSDFQLFSVDTEEKTKVPASP